MSFFKSKGRSASNAGQCVVSCGRICKSLVDTIQQVSTATVSSLVGWLVGDLLPPEKWHITSHHITGIRWVRERQTVFQAQTSSSLHHIHVASEMIANEIDLLEYLQPGLMPNLGLEGRTICWPQD